MDWLRRNPTVVPWVLLGADISIRIGARLYETYRGHYKDETVAPIQSTLPKLTPQENVDLPYPSDAYPGARDVTSSYGSLRVYEWGPEDGRKVLLVHGITTPCVALGGVAQGLVDRGCRVMLFDLPGRGYSSAPQQTPQSTRFFTTCILLAIASSPLAWTGSSNSQSRFALIGYSLGGGIAVDFTSHFSTLISSLILLAPGGLIRDDQFSSINKLLYNSGLLNETLVEHIVKRRLQAGAPPVTPRRPPSSSIPPNPTNASKSAELAAPPLSNRYPDIALPSVIAWQLEANRGFVPAYISSLRYGPISNQQETWARLGQRLNAQKLNKSIGNTSSPLREEEGLHGGRALIICGTTDVLILANELREDAAQCLGEGNFELSEVDAGHELPVTRSREIVELISEFWTK